MTLSIQMRMTFNRSVPDSSSLLGLQLLSDCFNPCRLDNTEGWCVWQERKHVMNSGLKIKRLSGDTLQPHHWDAFYEFYINTSGDAPPPLDVVAICK